MRISHCLITPCQLSHRARPLGTAWQQFASALSSDKLRTCKLVPMISTWHQRHPNQQAFPFHHFLSNSIHFHAFPHWLSGTSRLFNKLWEGHLLRVQSWNRWFGCPDFLARYYTGQLFDVPTITKAAHKVGANVPWSSSQHGLNSLKDVVKKQLFHSVMCISTIVHYPLVNQLLWITMIISSREFDDGEHDYAQSGFWAVVRSQVENAQGPCSYHQDDHSKTAAQRWKCIIHAFE